MIRFYKNKTAFPSNCLELQLIILYWNLGTILSPERDGERERERILHEEPEKALIRASSSSGWAM